MTHEEIMALSRPNSTFEGLKEAGEKLNITGIEKQNDAFAQSYPSLKVPGLNITCVKNCCGVALMSGASVSGDRTIENVIQQGVVMCKLMGYPTAVYYVTNGQKPIMKALEMHEHFELIDKNWGRGGAEILTYKIIFRKNK